MTGSALCFSSNFAFNIKTLPFALNASDVWNCLFTEQILIYLKRLKASGRNKKSHCLWKMKRQKEKHGWKHKLSNSDSSRFEWMWNEGRRCSRSCWRTVVCTKVLEYKYNGLCLAIEKEWMLVSDSTETLRPPIAWLLSVWTLLKVFSENCDDVFVYVTQRLSTKLQCDIGD